eukprot:scaffold129564_cov15-Tisochrysis_lutea.AAC.1
MLSKCRCLIIIILGQRQTWQAKHLPGLARFHDGLDVVVTVSRACRAERIMYNVTLGIGGPANPGWEGFLKGGA